MNKTFLGVIVGLAIAIGAYFIFSGNRALAGPHGGDVVPLGDGNAYAELLADADTGDLMVHTWDKDLKTARPIKAEPLRVGSGDKQTELTPHPMPGDPPGFCSRFYGHADWARGGNIAQGWIHHGGEQGHHQEFAWRQCWSGGRSHTAMWNEMPGRHGRGGMGHGPRH